MTNPKRNGKILIVDDEKEIRHMLKYICKGMGLTVDLVDDGQKAFRAASQGDYDLILLDIMMPGWNGIEAVKSLDFINKQPKVIVISGYVTEKLYAELAEVQNITEFIHKPFKVEHIRQLITETLNKDAEADQSV